MEHVSLRAAVAVLAVLFSSMAQAENSALCLSMLQDLTNQMAPSSGVPPMCNRLADIKQACGTTWDAVGSNFERLCDLRRQMENDKPSQPNTAPPAPANVTSPSRTTSRAPSSDSGTAAQSPKYVDRYGKPCVTGSQKTENLEATGVPTVILYTLNLVNSCNYAIDGEAVANKGSDPPFHIPANDATYVKCTDHSQAQGDCGGWKGWRETHRSP